MFQMHHVVRKLFSLPDVASVSPITGSLGGGAVLTITGRYFGRLKENVKVKVAGVNCHVHHVSPTVIKCTTGTADQRFLVGDLFPGNCCLYSELSELRPNSRTEG